MGYDQYDRYWTFRGNNITRHIRYQLCPLIQDRELEIYSQCHLVQSIRMPRSDVRPQTCLSIAIIASFDACVLTYILYILNRRPVGKEQKKTSFFGLAQVFSRLLDQTKGTFQVSFVKGLALREQLCMMSLWYLISS